MNGEIPSDALWDINAINLRIGPMQTDTDPEEIRQGNKYIIVEDFTGPDGLVIPQETFDYRRMWYTVLTAPRNIKHHADILEYNRDNGFISPTGNVVGGGKLWVHEDDEFYCLGEYSDTYKAEPLVVRKKIGELLRSPVTETFGEREWKLRLRKLAEAEYVSEYWRRFGQIS